MLQCRDKRPMCDDVTTARALLSCPTGSRVGYHYCYTAPTYLFIWWESVSRVSRRRGPCIQRLMPRASRLIRRRAWAYRSVQGARVTRARRPAASNRRTTSSWDSRGPPSAAAPGTGPARSRIWIWYDYLSYDVVGYSYSYSYSSPYYYCCH